MAELPTGTVTFLFTDLEGSTRLWEVHPRAMKQALARHDEIIRDAIVSHGGYVVKTTGDGFHAVFARAGNALEAASAAQYGLHQEVWDTTGPLKVRMGLHTCEAELRDGDYYGSAVNRAARLMSTGHGGQVLLSAATAELARETGADIVDLGEVRLRDLSRPERVLQLCPDGLPSEFPPPKSLDAVPGNLAVQLSSFIGRDEELAAVAKQLARSRLVTLTGVGGVGKTRLAVQVAAEVAPQYAHGAWLCELAPIRDTDALDEIVGSALGISRRSGMLARAGIVDALRSRQLLLVLDNCEHLLDALSALSHAILRDAPQVSILATSREQLGVDGEQTWPVRPLGDAEARDLFVDRAGAARPGFEVDSANASAVADVCSRLDGIPLAIELAAARVVALSPSDLSARLDERFRLLTGGRRDADDRHQTLRATVDWSYSLLPDRDRIVFDRLAVFSGSFDANAAEAVCAGDGIEPWDVLDAVTSLVAKSMLASEPTSAGGIRYRLLATLREYAAERLGEQSHTDVWQRRHAEHYVSFAEIAGIALCGPDELTWRAVLHAELDNLRAAVMWSLGVGGQLAVRLVAALAHECINESASSVASWAALAREPARHSLPAQRVAVLGAIAFILVNAGDWELGRQVAEDALRDGIPADCPAPELPFVALALALVQAGQTAGVGDVFAEGRRQLEAADASSFARAFLENTTVFASALIGEAETAREHSDAALALARQTQNPSLLAEVLVVRAMCAMTIKPEAALDDVEESIALTRAGASGVVLGFALAMRSTIRAADGDDVGALADAREAIAFSFEKGDRMMLLTALGRSGDVLAAFGHAEPAAVLGGVTSEGPFASMDSLPREERPRRHKLLNRVRSVLGGDEFARATGRGAAMTLAEATRFAIAQLDRLLEERDDG